MRKEARLEMGELTMTIVRLTLKCFANVMLWARKNVLLRFWRSLSVIDLQTFVKIQIHCTYNTSQLSTS
jgi:hypothetical protein